MSWYYWAHQKKEDTCNHHLTSFKRLSVAFKMGLAFHFVFHSWLCKRFFLHSWADLPSGELKSTRMHAHTAISINAWEDHSAVRAGIFLLSRSGLCSSCRNPAVLPNCWTRQLPEGESAFAQGGSGCPCEQLNSGNMADAARPAQQLLVSNTLGLIDPCFTLGATLKVTSPKWKTHLWTALQIQTLKCIVFWQPPR